MATYTDDEHYKMLMLIKSILKERYKVIKYKHKRKIKNFPKESV